MIGKSNWISSVTVKGQATIPFEIRSLLHLKPGKDLLGFFVRGRRVEIRPVSVKDSDWKFSAKEWKKIKKISREKGEIFQSFDSFSKRLNAL